MKKLTLVRHAKAEDALSGQSDFERKLHPRGLKEADKMARRLVHRGARVDCIVTSHAPRALATAQAFADVLKLKRVHEDERLYLAPPKDILQVLREYESHEHILMVAHNPGVAECADQLSSERGIDTMPTCAVVEMELPIDDWSELDWHMATAVELDYPGKPA